MWINEDIWESKNFNSANNFKPKRYLDTFWNDKLDNEFISLDFKKQQGKDKEISFVSQELEKLHENINTNTLVFIDKISNLSSLNNIETWKSYFEVSFDKFWIWWNSFEEKFNNFCEKYGIKYIIDSTEFWYKKWEVVKYNEKNFKDLKSLVIKSLIDYYDKKEFEKLNKKLDGIEHLRDIRIDNKNLSLAYFVYLEKTIERQENQVFSKKVLELQKKYQNNEISKKEYENQIEDIYLRKTQNIVWDMKQKANYIEIFENWDLYDNEKTKIAVENWIRFRKKENTIFAYTTDWTFIKSFEENELQHNIDEIIKNYKNVKLKDILNLQIDQETNITLNYVEDATKIDNIKIPLYYANILKSYQDKGYIFKISSFDWEWFEMIIIKNWNIVWSINSWNIQNWKTNLWLDILVNRVLSNIDEKKEKIQNLELKIPNIEEKITFVNEIYNLYIDENWKFKWWNFYVWNWVWIWLKQWLPLDEIFAEIPNIIDRLHNSNVNLYELLANNIFGILPNSQEFLQQFNISEKDYEKTNILFSNMVENIFIKIIDERPELALKNIVSLSDHLLWSKVDLKSWYKILNNNGTNHIIIWILDRIFAKNISLKDSKEVGDLFKKYPYLEENLNNSLKSYEKQQTLTNWMTSQDIQSSVGYEKINNIQWFIKDEFLFENLDFQDMIKWKEENLKQKIVLEAKLMLSRNLYLQNTNNYENLVLTLQDDQKCKKLIGENLKIIFEKRKEIYQNNLFDNDIFHIAHYWQDVNFDNFWTVPTQNALKKQAWENNYSLFDAQDIFKKDIDVWKQDLDKYIDWFIHSPKKSMIITEWHWNNETFSVLQRYWTADKLWINHTSFEMIDITPKDLVDIIIKREKFKQENKISWQDTILFAACRWDYALNFYKILNENKDKIPLNFIPPIMITAAESWENSIWSKNNLDKEIPWQIFRYVFDIWSNKKTTFWTFFENQYNENMWSNPTLFYPIKIWEKWVPQQLG